MKQATGSNTPQSIQQGVHSANVGWTLFFGRLRCPGSFRGPHGPVEVELLTPRTTLVPEELFDEACAGELLAADRHGRTAADECPVWSAPGSRMPSPSMAAAENALAAVR